MVAPTLIVVPGRAVLPRGMCVARATIAVTLRSVVARLAVVLPIRVALCLGRLWLGRARLRRRLVPRVRRGIRVGCGRVGRGRIGLHGFGGNR
jgi:hypothetical protein